MVSLGGGVATAAASTAGGANETATTAEPTDEPAKTTDREHGSSNADLIAWALGVLLTLGAGPVVTLLRE
ncbi:hypothetical protein [Halorubellus litoreus]|uniref:PGF-CTERM protein n=1 Tax=Halorubellus litoreus TaxID=755308 RepID=A0ABD5VAL6_9EURY